MMCCVFMRAVPLLALVVECLERVMETEGEKGDFGLDPSTDLSIYLRFCMLALYA